MEDLLKNIFVINLKTREDRWKKCLEQFRKAGIEKCERFDAIKLEFSKINPILYSKFNMKHSNSYITGAMGCKLSHLSILKEAQRRGLDSILILEDDFVMCEDFKEKLKKVLEDTEKSIDLNMLYLGFSVVRASPFTHTDIPNVKKMINAHTTHAYVVYKKFYDTIINFLETTHSEIDVCYSKLQKYEDIYGVYPCLITQGKSYSDIMGKVVDYSKVIKFEG